MPSLDHVLKQQADNSMNQVYDVSLSKSPWTDLVKEASGGDVPKGFVMDEKTRWAKIKEMEKAVERLFVGAFALEGNELNIRATLWNDMKEWQYHLKIEYTLNGKVREVRKDFDVHGIEHPRDIVVATREAVLEDLADFITQDFAEKNQKVLINAARESY